MALNSDMQGFPISGVPVLGDIANGIALNTTYKQPLRPSGLLIDTIGNSRMLGTLQINGTLTGVTSLTMNGNLSIGTTTPAFLFEVAGNGSTATLSNSVYSNTANDAAGFIGRKARGTLGSPSAVQADDILGGFYGGGYTSAGSFGTNSGRFSIHAAQNFTSANQGSYMTFSVTPLNSSSRSEVMRITSSGNVGIGTTTPTSRLDVGQSLTSGQSGFIRFSPGSIADVKVGAVNLTGTNYPGIWFGQTSPSITNYAFLADSSITLFNAPSGGQIRFRVNNADMMTLLSSGAFGIGTIAPSAKLDINSDVLRLRTAKTPATAGASGNQGDIAWDANYVYVCTATNTWKRSAIATW